MQLTTSDRDAAARSLRDAVKSGSPTSRLTSRFPAITAEDAYAIQLLNIDARLGSGRTIAGHKVGLTSAVMQQMFGVDQPDFGHVLDDMIVADGGRVDHRRFLKPKVEIEIAFLLGERLFGADVTAADVRRATERVVPSIEIIDSRFDGWDITFFDTVADNASAGAIVLGSSPVTLEGLDLAATDARLLVNGEVRLSGSTGAVLGDPANAVAWLARTLHAFGTALEPGHVVLPGSCTAALSVQPGDVVAAEFEGIGSVEVSFG